MTCIWWLILPITKRSGSFASRLLLNTNYEDILTYDDDEDPGSIATVALTVGLPYGQSLYVFNKLVIALKKKNYVILSNLLVQLRGQMSKNWRRRFNSKFVFDHLAARLLPAHSSSSHDKYIGPEIHCLTVAAKPEPRIKDEYLAFWQMRIDISTDIPTTTTTHSANRRTFDCCWRRSVSIMNGAGENCVSKQMRTFLLPVG